ncbi:MAG: hypothetical protein EOO85_24985 [Pedobacter sp.]|nr:MAG: hypothetical protein EOO85_24985 [Pedobacter sp.]
MKEYKLMVNDKELIAKSTGTGYKFDGITFAMWFDYENYDQPLWNGEEAEARFYKEVVPYLVSALKDEKANFMDKIKHVAKSINSIEEIDASLIEIKLADDANLESEYGAIIQAAEANNTFNTNLQIVVYHKDEEYEIQLNGYIAKFKVSNPREVEYKIMYNDGWYKIYKNGFETGLYSEGSFENHQKHEEFRMIKKNYLEMYNHYKN